MTFKVADRRCDQCLFGKNKIVSDARKDQILRGCEHKNRYFECHKGTLRGEKIVCAGFAESEARGAITNSSLQIAGRLGLISLVDPETGLPRVAEGSRAGIARKP